MDFSFLVSWVDVVLMALIGYLGYRVGLRKGLKKGEVNQLYARIARLEQQVNTGL